MIKYDDLRNKAWYYGMGKFGMIAYWDSKTFLSINPHNNSLVTQEYDTEFKPLYVIDSAFTQETLNVINQAFNAINK